MPLPVAWSYSSLNTFESCPKKFYHLRVAKDVVDTPSEQVLWGQEVHKALEERMLLGLPLPEHLSQHEKMLARLEALPGEKLVERQLGVTESLDPCDFFAPEVWYRGVIDFAVVNDTKAIALDYKTGKPKDDFDQLSLFAALLFAHYPRLTSVRTGYLWLKTGQVTKLEFSNRHSVWKEFIPRVHRLEKAYEKSSWLPRPSGLCGWCPVKSCKHWTQR